MRKRRLVIGLVSLAAVAALGTGCALRTRGIGPPQRKEYAVIAIRMQDGMCKVFEDKISKIRTSFGHTVTWIIVGSCEGSHTVSIGEFTKRGKPLDPTESDKREASAADGARIHAKVKPEYPQGRRGPKTLSGIYVYQVLIDGKPAVVFKVAPGGKAPENDLDPGEFDVCPTWPCDY